eukprot:scaffold15662_cov62-Phaeocystis_antarctica.AAC.2
MRTDEPHGVCGRPVALPVGGDERSRIVTAEWQHGNRAEGHALLLGQVLRPMPLSAERGLLLREPVCPCGCQNKGACLWRETRVSRPSSAEGIGVPPPPPT